MGETNGREVVIAGEFDTELLEAIALLSGVYGGAVFLPASFQGVDVHEVRRDLVKLMDPVHVEVTHLARYTSHAQGGTNLFEGLSFVHQTCPLYMKIGFRPSRFPVDP